MRVNKQFKTRSRVPDKLESCQFCHTFRSKIAHHLPSGKSYPQTVLKLLKRPFRHFLGHLVHSNYVSRVWVLINLFSIKVIYIGHHEGVLLRCLYSAHVSCECYRVGRYFFNERAKETSWSQLQVAAAPNATCIVASCSSFKCYLRHVESASGAI